MKMIKNKLLYSVTVLALFGNTAFAESYAVTATVVDVQPISAHQL